MTASGGPKNALNDILGVFTFCRGVRRRMCITFSVPRHRCSFCEDISKRTTRCLISIRPHYL